MCESERNIKNYMLLECRGNTGAVHISMPFVEESFDPGDMLIINDTHFDTTELWSCTEE